MKSMVELSHEFLLPTLHKQAICIDATLGRGKDSQFFLSHKVHSVIAFEIQEDVLKECSIQDVHFHPYLMGHERMDEIVQQSVDCIVFNFGYCPGKTEEVHTNANTSLIAVTKGLNLLKRKGRMALVFYPHESGMKEAEMIEQYLMSLDSNMYSILKIKLLNQTNSPYLVEIEKK